MLKHCLSVIIVATLLLSFVGGCCAAEIPAADLPKVEIIRLGERMYRGGILPSGKVMEAFIRGDVEVDSTAFSCSSCHLRAGLGSVEGGVVTPPTNGKKLYQPYRRPPSLNDIPDQSGRIIYAKTVLERPAYTRETLAKALRFGIDPAGQIFNDVMPRYPLAERDMAILISYLEQLSAEPSPGASSNQYSFATVIAGEVSETDRQALLQPLQGIIAQKNQQLALYNDFLKFGYQPTADMKYSFRGASLDIWELRGAPGTWQGQLAAYYAKNPVFAVLGGLSNSDWQPIHDFCEAQRLPCLFPITGFPVNFGPGWYTFYFDKGYAQEGEAVARYLNSLETAPAADRILQIVDDTPVGRALADGFQRLWSELERPPLTTITLSASQLQDTKLLPKLLAEHNVEALLLWSKGVTFEQIPKILAGETPLQMIFVSSGYLGKSLFTLPEAVRDKVYISYPWRLTPYVGPKTGGHDSRIPILASARDLGDRRITSRTISVLQQSIFPSLSLLNDNLQRDNLLDVMGMQMDLVVKDYERLSFGPGQRHASKGCYIIQLGPGSEPALLPRSEWLTH